MHSSDVFRIYTLYNLKQYSPNDVEKLYIFFRNFDIGLIFYKWKRLIRFVLFNKSVYKFMLKEENLILKLKFISWRDDIRKEKKI